MVYLPHLFVLFVHRYVHIEIPDIYYIETFVVPTGLI